MRPTVSTNYTYLVIIDGQDKLSGRQLRLLSNRELTFLELSVSKLDRESMYKWRKFLIDLLDFYPRVSLVFASPVPYLIREVGRLFPPSRVRVLSGDHLLYCNKYSV